MEIGEGTPQAPGSLGAVAALAGTIAARWAGEPAVAAAARDLAAAATAASGGRTDTGQDRVGAEWALRRDLAALASGTDAAWAKALAGALAGGGGVGRTARGPIRARAGTALGTLLAGGEPPDGALALLVACGLVGAYLGMAGSEEAGRDAARAARLAPGGARAIAEDLLEWPPGDSPGHVPLWAALLRGSGAWTSTLCHRKAWEHLLACAGGDGELLEGILGDGRLVGRRDSPELRVAAERLDSRARARALGARAGAREGRDEIGQELARTTAPRALRALALRRAAAEPGEDPDTAQPAAWEALSLAKRHAWAGGARPTSAASRLRCAHWLAARPTPAWRAALILAAGEGPAGRPLLEDFGRRGDPGALAGTGWDIGAALPEGCARQVGALLATEPNSWAARWLVARAPELASADALGRAGLLDDRGADAPARRRAAGRALQAAWSAALAPGP